MGQDPATRILNHQSPQILPKNPSSLAYSGMFGKIDFNSTPLAPPGTKYLIHVKPNNMRTFGTHAIDG